MPEQLRVAVPKVEPMPDMRVTRDKPPRNRFEILEPLSVRERLLVCGVADTVRAIERMERDNPTFQGLELARPLLIAFKDGTGVDWATAPWSVD